MNDYDQKDQAEEIFSKVLRAGRRTYFFDVRSTKADDYYLTITESKKHTNENGNFFYKKHKIYLYKEDFENFAQMLQETTNFILEEKGSEVISDTHQSDFHKKYDSGSDPMQEREQHTGGNYTDVDFDDI
jgi:hypothetical protein